MIKCTALFYHVMMELVECAASWLYSICIKCFKFPLGVKMSNVWCASLS